MATVSVEPAEDCWGPMLCINTHDEELTPKHNYVVQFNYSEELDEFIARLQAARDAWEEDPS